jgi:hypothetical protein
MYQAAVHHVFPARFVIGSLPFAQSGPACSRRPTWSQIAITVEQCILAFLSVRQGRLGKLEFARAADLE